MQTAAKLWYLEQFNVMDALSQRERMDMAKMIVDKYYKKDEPIMFPFNSQKTVYLLKEGSVKIGNYTENGEENLKYVLGSGNIFGEMALSDGNATDFAVATDDCIICTMNLATLEDIMMRNKNFNIAIYKLIGLRLRKLETKLTSIIFKDSTTRIIDFLEEFAKDFGKQKEGALLVKNFLTNKEIAKLTFTSRQTVNSVLNKLKRNGNIDFNDKHITIFDLQNT
jgi:CRP/FNR family cyclic AMP-dependent transcriptional regulator